MANVVLHGADISYEKLYARILTCRSAGTRINPNLTAMSWKANQLGSVFAECHKKFNAEETSEWQSGIK